jgi:hypothetical protein
VRGAAELAIEVPHQDGGAPPVPTPCQILDARLRPVGACVADGSPHPVPAGWLVLLITLPGGDARRIGVALQEGGSYRLYVHGTQPPAAAELADAEALETMHLLDAGRVAEALTLADRRLPAIEKGELGDPVAITAVAYALVQAWDRERLGTWCLDLADRHPRLSDGFVIGAEWHALAGNHLTALSYLRRLGSEAPLPLFALGVTRALDRLAGYRTLTLDGTPSERLRRRDLPTGPSAGQLLNRWDVAAAAVLYDELSLRSGRRSPKTVLTTPAKDPAPPGARARIASFERDLVQRLARAASKSPRRSP